MQQSHIPAQAFTTSGVRAVLSVLSHLEDLWEKTGNSRPTNKQAKRFPGKGILQEIQGDMGSETAPSGTACVHASGAHVEWIQVNREQDPGQVHQD
jgi:hypothetical protein